jgi:hypothetical protein
MIAKFHRSPSQQWLTILAFLLVYIAIGSSLSAVNISNKGDAFASFGRRQHAYSFTDLTSGERKTDSCLINCKSSQEKRTAFQNKKTERHQARFTLIYDEELEALGFTQNAHILENARNQYSKEIPAAKFGVRKQGTWGLDILHV